MKRKFTVWFIVCSMLAMATSCSTNSPAESSSTEKPSAETTSVKETEPAETTEEVITEPEYPKPDVDENAITYNDSDDLYTAHCMAEKNFENDEAECRLSVAEFKGEKQLRIEVLGYNEETKKYKTPKIVFDVDELVGSDNLSKVKSFSCDITQVAVGEFIGDDGEPMMVPGNLMGSFGSITGENSDVWYEPTGSANEYAMAEWKFGWEYLHVEGKWLLKGFVDGTTNSTLVFMRWSIPNQADVYIDNLTFYDEEGNSIPIVYKPGEASDEASEGEAAEEPASEEADGGTAAEEAQDTDDEAAAES